MQLDSPEDTARPGHTTAKAANLQGLGLQLPQALIQDQRWSNVAIPNHHGGLTLLKADVTKAHRRIRRRCQIAEAVATSTTAASGARTPRHGALDAPPVVGFRDGYMTSHQR